MDTIKTNKPAVRAAHALIQEALTRKKSVLLLGPRQTGKSTLVKHVPADLAINFLLPSERQRFEKDPELLLREIATVTSKKVPMVILDEVQKVPALLDIVQYAIDERKAQFILLGSSARKLKNEIEDGVPKFEQ